MRIKDYKYAISALCFGVIFGFVSPSTSATNGHPVDIAIVVHKDNPQTDISLHELRALFLQHKKQWNNGKKIVVLNHPAKTKIRTTFDKLVLKLDPAQAASYWINEQIRGNGRPPRSIASSRILQRIIMRYPAFVSYVWIKERDPNLKVLKIDGKLPGMKGYPLSMSK